MGLAVEDLLCPSCAGYVHPFLERCPACGTDRPGRQAEAAAGSLGLRGLRDDPAVLAAVRSVVLRYSLRLNEGPPATALLDGFESIAGSLSYRARVTADGPTSLLPAGRAEAEPAGLGLADESVVIRTAPAGRTIAAVPLEAVLAATPIVKGRPAPAAWVGPALGGRRLLERETLGDADLLITFGTREAAGQLALANRRGFMAPKARSDHYVTLAGWLAILAASAAEARWIAVGPAIHAAEVGLGDPRLLDGAADRPAPPVGELADTAGRAGAGVGEPGGPATIAGDSASTVRPADEGRRVRAALEELEGLRAADLVSDDEYAAKRAEILARL